MKLPRSKPPRSDRSGTTQPSPNSKWLRLPELGTRAVVGELFAELTESAEVAEVGDELAQRWPPANNVTDAGPPAV